MAIFGFNTRFIFPWFSELCLQFGFEILWHDMNMFCRCHDSFAEFMRSFGALGKFSLIRTIVVRAAKACQPLLYNQEVDGLEFKIDDEIDQATDMFITRFQTR